MPDRMERDMDLARFRRIVEAWGASPRRWPPAERAAAEAFLAASPEAARLVEDAASLDTLLDAVPAPRPTAALAGRLLQRPARRAGRGWLAELWPFGPVWQPVSAFAAAALFGIALGAAEPGTVFPDTGDVMQQAAESIAFGVDLGMEAGQ